MITVISIIGLLAGLISISWKNWLGNLIYSGFRMQISSYNKVAQEYFIKYNDLPSLYDLENEVFVSSLACKYNDPIDCKNSVPAKASTRLIGGSGNWNTYWPSPSGHCKIKYRAYGYYVQLFAIPHHNSPYSKWTSITFFNSQTGCSKLTENSYNVSTYTLYNKAFC